MMTYKGYDSTVAFDDEAGIFHGEVIGLRDVVTFQGTSVEELRQSFQESVDDYLDFCVERGEEPDKAFSGKFMLRIDPNLHRRLSTLSQQEGKSLNRWVEDKLENQASSAK